MNNSNTTSFFSKKTGNKIIDIEKFKNSYVYWCYELVGTDKRISLPYSGTNEVTIQEGEEIINYLHNKKSLYK